MEDSTVAILVMLNNLLHDFAVALLFASLLVQRMIHRVTQKQGYAHGGEFTRILYLLFNKVIVGCWVVILLGGVIRTLAYERYEWNEAAGRGQVTALVVKHIILVMLIVWGTVIQLRLRKHWKRTPP